jgi:hypothetical protein
VSVDVRVPEPEGLPVAVGDGVSLVLRDGVGVSLSL